MDTNTIVATGIVTVVSFILALLHCFFGYKLQKIWVALMAFGAGALIGYLVASAFGAPNWVLWLAALALAIVFVTLSFKMYLAGVFVLAFSLVFICAKIAIHQTTAQWLVILVGGILVGILAVKFTRTVLILATALGGGVTAGQSLLGLTGLTALMGAEGLLAYVPLLVGLVIAGFGIWFQYKTTKKGA